ncbi:MAG: PD40 domain-containing protein [Anaerolineae bacterium]|nr:PD40 domain-containing protein [Anaerolineae bacterium]
MKKITTISLFIMSVFTACAQQSEVNNGLVVQHMEDDVRQIYQVSPEDSDTQLLIEFSSLYLFWIAPNGDYIAVLDRFSKPDSILTLYDLQSGEELDTLTNVGQMEFEDISYQENIVWSPDSQSFAFLRLSEGRNGTDLWMYDVNSREVTQITADETVERSPSWSPDGSKLAYARHSVCSSTAWDCADEDNYWQIFVTGIADEQDAQLLVDMKQETELQQIPWLYRSICNLSWSPDMKFILFEDGCRTLGPNIYKSLYVVGVAEKGGLVELINDSNYDILVTYESSWTQDSKRIHVAYSTMPFGPPIEPETRLSAAIQIFETEHFSVINEFKLSPEYGLLDMAWSDDGTRLAVSPVDDQATVIDIQNDDFVIAAQTQFPHTICFSPYWDTSGRYLAYISESENSTCNVNGLYSVVVTDLSTGDISEISDIPVGWNRIVGWYPVR